MTRSGALGLLVDWIDEQYQSRIIAAADEVAQKHDRHLVCFVGGALESQVASGAHRNFIYDWVSRGQVDGVVLLSGTLSNAVGPAGLARYAERFRPLPLCSVGVALEGIPSVLVDNARGMRALLLHLTDVHGYRRLAFIRGPAASEEAESRFAVYREVLAERDLEFTPSLVTDGEFLRVSGREAIRTLIDERRVRFDAVVAANDGMAFGAIEALTLRGLRVPHEVAVVGFDDVASARFSSPPLTTVRQPLRDQGLVAAQQVLAALHGERAANLTVLRTQLVLRQSCGCPVNVGPSVAQYQPLVATRSLRDTLRSNHDRIDADLARAMRAVGATFELGWGRRLLEALEAELGSTSTGTFLAVLEELLEAAAALGGNVGAWHGVISLLRHHARAAAEIDATGHARAEELWQEARVLVSSVGERSHARARLRTEQWMRQLRTLGETIRSTEDASSRWELLQSTLPELGLRSGYLVELEQGQPDPVGRLRVRFDRFGSAEDPRPGTRFPAFELLPGGLGRLARRTSFALEPLFAGDRPLGYALLELGGVDDTLYESVRREICIALRSSDRVECPRTHGLAETRAALVPAYATVEGYHAATYVSTLGDAVADYCEVLPFQGGCWLGLGQIVSARADASAVTLMIQAAVAALVSQKAIVAPRELLLTLNAVLFENLQRRLKSEQHAELTLMQCDQGGRVVFAGAGASILICRGRDGQVARLQSTGAAVGAVHDIGRSLQNTHCQLEPGDVLVAHTAPLTAQYDARGERFGAARLSLELEQWRTLPVDELRDHLVAVLTDWTGQAPHGSMIVARHGWEPPSRSRPQTGEPPTSRRSDHARG